VSTEFQISYTLDVLLYIGCMIDEEKRDLYEEDIDTFMPMLGTISDKYLEKLKKINKGTPGFINYIISIVIVNDHLHDWTTTDLLDRHKRLVTVFKKTAHFKKASSVLKKFINNDFSKTMPLIKVIVTDLDRLGFKKFWLEEKLPLLKERTAEYQKVLSEFNIARYVNSWVVDKKIPVNGQWYILAYSGNQYKPLLGKFNVIAPITPADQLFHRVVSYVLKAGSYRKFCKALKPDSDLKAEYKKHKLYKSFKGISDYAEVCLKKALSVYLIDDYHTSELEIPANYPFATVIHGFLCENEKPIDVAIGVYVIDMMKKLSR